MNDCENIKKMNKLLKVQYMEKPLNKVKESKCFGSNEANNNNKLD